MRCRSENELEGWRKFQKLFGYTEPEASSSALVYYVQVGAFKSKANLEAYLTLKKYTKRFPPLPWE